MGVQRLRSPMPPCTRRSVGPDPAHSTAIGVPSSDATRTIVLSRTVSGRDSMGVLDLDAPQPASSAERPVTAATISSNRERAILTPVTQSGHVICCLIIQLSRDVHKEV